MLTLRVGGNHQIQQNAAADLQSDCPNHRGTKVSGSECVRVDSLGSPAADMRGARSPTFATPASHQCV